MEARIVPITEIEEALGTLRGCEREVAKLEAIVEKIAGQVGVCIGCWRVVDIEGCTCSRETIQ